ncbi:MAG: DNA mismatch repair endonuclease MutL [Syntrophales bacterium]|nr:DNA mismatch repair endonuclease MutL [Syntrophales bacterium]
MANRIHILDPDVTMKIAAGEIIERPASIVKELLENAIDAQASTVKIELKEGGKEEIVIADNGHGITSQDIPFAFLRYATSKINSLEDLSSLKSFGFRGEALPSIASVARVEMISRPPEQATGIKIVVEEGKTIEQGEIGCPTGTQVRVTRLFHHIPARKKFLKSAATEKAYCLEVITRILLGVDNLRAEVIIDGRHSLLFPSSVSTEERLALLLGREVASHLAPIRTAVEGQYRVSGFISDPNWHRTNSKGIYCYVNQRPVRDVIINHALLQAYKNILPPGKYPVAIIRLEVPPSELDVNVHPTKMEVRFENPKTVYALVAEAILHSLSKFTPEGPMVMDIHNRIEEAVERYYVEAKKPLRDLNPLPIEDKPSDDFVYLGQINGCFLLFQTPQGLVIIDQHAAHERILFDRLNERDLCTPLASQSLLLPIVMSLSPQEFASAETLIPEIKDFGFEIEPFGPQTVAIKAVPSIFSAEEATLFLREMIGNSDLCKLPSRERRNQILASLACKGAISAPTYLTAEKACHLFRDLKETKNPATCPHGRPTFVRFTSEDLEKMFKRR